MNKSPLDFRAAKERLPKKRQDCKAEKVRQNHMAEAYWAANRALRAREYRTWRRYNDYWNWNRGYLEEAEREELQELIEVRGGLLQLKAGGDEK